MWSKKHCLAVTAFALLCGCNDPPVGDPCLPEQIPDDGFKASETYIENASVQCETRVCMVRGLSGDPRLDESGDCPGSTQDPPVVCASESDIEASVYCTCRCDAAGGDFATCDCPAGFTCQQVLELGGPGIRGKYCVRQATM